MGLSKSERQDLAKRRITNILRNYIVCNARTLEQKISDAGPGNQRVDPHVLTGVRNSMVDAGLVRRDKRQGVPWYSLTKTARAEVKDKLSVLLPLHKRLIDRAFTTRLGQTLEIATLKALRNQSILSFFGFFPDLDDHDDSVLYKKEEPPPTISGKTIAPGRLDFLVNHREAGYAGIELKNVREWMYPRRTELDDLLKKCLALDCIPVFVARRIPFVTFKVFSTCGVVFHQTYNQLFPSTDSDLADHARAKNLFGYHDVRLGNEPDSRLIKFICTNLPKVLPSARERFDDYQDLLEGYSSRAMAWPEFAARVRRRREGVNEDTDFPWPEDVDPGDAETYETFEP